MAKSDASKRHNKEALINGDSDSKILTLMATQDSGRNGVHSIAAFKQYKLEADVLNNPTSLVGSNNTVGKQHFKADQVTKEESLVVTDSPEETTKFIPANLLQFPCIILNTPPAFPKNPITPQKVESHDNFPVQPQAGKIFLKSSSTLLQEAKIAAPPRLMHSLLSSSQTLLDSSWPIFKSPWNKAVTQKIPPTKLLQVTTDSSKLSDDNTSSPSVSSSVKNDSGQYCKVCRKFLHQGVLACLACAKAKAPIAPVTMFQLSSVKAVKYTCQWLGCTKTFPHPTDLIEHMTYSHERINVDDDEFIDVVSVEEETSNTNKTVVEPRLAVGTNAQDIINSITRTTDILSTIQAEARQLATLPVPIQTFAHPGKLSNHIASYSTTNSSKENEFVVQQTSSENLNKRKVDAIDLVSEPIPKEARIEANHDTVTANDDGDDIIFIGLSTRGGTPSLATPHPVSALTQIVKQEPLVDVYPLTVIPESATIRPSQPYGSWWKNLPMRYNSFMSVQISTEGRCIKWGPVYSKRRLLLVGGMNNGASQISVFGLPDDKPWKCKGCVYPDHTVHSCTSIFEQYDSVPLKLNNINRLRFLDKQSILLSSGVDQDVVATTWQPPSFENNSSRMPFRLSGLFGPIGQAMDINDCKIAAGDSKGNVAIWQTPQTINEHNDRVNPIWSSCIQPNVKVVDVSFDTREESSTSPNLCAALANGSMILMNSNQPSIQAIKAHNAPLSSVCFSAGRILSSDEAGEVRLWDIRKLANSSTAQPLMTLGHSSRTVSKMCWANKRHWATAIGAELSLWAEKKSVQRIFTHAGHQAIVQDFDLCPEFQDICSIGTDSLDPKGPTSIQIWQQLVQWKKSEKNEEHH